MARRLRAAMALLLLQALPEGLPAGAEPAQFTSPVVVFSPAVYTPVTSPTLTCMFSDAQ